MHKHNVNFFFFICLIFLLDSCANIVTPRGGEKDTEAPKVIRCEPKNYSVNFHSRTISISFSEFIQLKDISNQMIVSPLLKEQPEVKIRNKSLVVSLPDSLKPNTTYAINFGNAIADITESNVLENYQYVFSTGDHLDSLDIKGKTMYAKDLSTEKGILIMLYEGQDDSLPLKQRPLYFARTTESGSFRMTNLRPGEYKMVALKDVNNNYLFDQPNESIAYTDQPVQAGTKDTINLALFEEAPKRQQLLKAFSPEQGKILLTFRRPATNITIRALHASSGKKHWELNEYSAGKDSLTCWITEDYLDTLKWEIAENGAVLDTAVITLRRKDMRGTTSKKNLQDPRLSVQTSINGPAFDSFRKINLTLSHPVKE